MDERSQPVWLRLPPLLQKVYACLFIGGVIIRLPWWTLKYLIPAARPRKNMSLRRCLIIQALRTSFSLSDSPIDSLIHTPTSKVLEIGKGVKGTFISPLPESLITGKLQTWARTAKVTPMPCPIYWIHKSNTDTILEGSPPSPDEKVVLFLHGGAYMLLSGHPSCAVTNVAKSIVDAVPSVKRALSLEYRLSAQSNRIVAPEDQNPFPAALMDALQGYWYLVNKAGYKESQIVVVGDSAGGNLALAMTRYLIEHAPPSETNANVKEKLPETPGHLVLLSPWVDLSGSFSNPEGSHYANRRTDFISLPDPPHITAPLSFIAPFGDPAAISRDVYLSPASLFLSDKEASFDGFPRSFVSAGADEILLDQIRKLQERMKRAVGEDGCVYFEVEGVFHDWLAMPEVQPEGRLTLEAIKLFLDG